MMHLGDITHISGNEVPAVDCVIGGSPCQDLSIAGKRAGLAGERSGLFMEQIRIVKRMREADCRVGRPDHLVRQPRFMVWENVPGAFSSNGGQDFRVVLEETIRIAESDAPDIPLPEKWPLADCWMGDGWSVAYRVLDAQFWGVPQRRRRIALVCDFGGHAAPETLFERQGLPQHYAESGETGEETTAGVGGGADCAVTGKAGERGGNTPCVGYSQQSFGEYIANEKAASIRASHDSCTANLVVRLDGQRHTVRRLTPLETERLQGFPDNWTDIGPWTDSKGKLHKESSDSARYKALGNSIALPPWTWVLKRLCGCYELPATMASLFDGIGAFPLIWERLNGPGTCLWASEIDEFPIAVTKRHFPHAFDERRF